MLRVEVVFATSERQELVSLELPEHSRVSAAIDDSNISNMFPDHDLSSLQVGIWGRPVSADRELCDGDRVELYRPLPIDPRNARRNLAAEGKLMGQASVLRDDDTAITDQDVTPGRQQFQKPGHSRNR